MGSTADIVADDLDRVPHEVWARLRMTAPVVWVPAVGGWVVTTRELAAAVMRDAAMFTVDDPRFSTAQVVGPSMLSLDGPEHHRHRSPFAAAYRPAEIDRRYPEFVEATAHRLVAALVPLGRAELRRQLAGPLAVAVVAHSLGLEEVDPAALLGWYDHIVGAVEAVSRREPVSEPVRAAFGELGNAITDAATRPDSLLHEVVGSLTPPEVVANAAVFLFGGIETSEGMTASLLMHLLAHPDQLERLRGDRSLLDNAIEESLRLEPAAARVDRYATSDVRLGGVAIRRGDLVVVSLSAANRDPATFELPDEFDIARPNAHAHLSFAVGPHGCLGARLARLETRAAATAMLDLLPGIALDAPAPVRGIVFRKPIEVQARWSVASFGGLGE